MLTSTVRLFRVKGVPVGISWTWLFVFALVFWSLAAGFFPAAYPGSTRWTYLTMALVATVLFFCSILVHELSHTVRAVQEGVRVREITLWLLGGVSQTEDRLPGPGAEFRIVIAGPMASAALVVVFGVLTVSARALGAPEPVLGVLEYLVWINALLLAFNVVPALPLDGGRLLHSLLWWRQGDSAAATISAARVGRIFGAVLMGLGFVSLLTGAAVSGIWLLVLGWFLLLTVHQEVVSARLERAFTGVRVRDLMARSPVTVAPDLTIKEFADRIGRWPAHAAYPVVRGGGLVGLLPLVRAAGVPKQRRDTLRVADVMIAAPDVPVVHPDDLLVDAARTLQREPGRAVVLDGSAGAQIVGLLSITDVSRALDVAPLRESAA